MKKFVLLIMVLCMTILMPLNVLAETREVKEEMAKEKINVYIFWGNGCGYCEAAINFFESIEDEYGKYFNLVKYEVWYEKDNNTLKENVAAYFGDDVTGVPYIVIGDETFGGYAEEYNEDLKEAIVDAYEDDDYIDVVAKVNAGEVETKSNYDTLIVIGIFAVVIGGFGALIYFSRK